MNVSAVIEGMGHFVPDQVLTNHQLEQMVDTSDEWIVQRTGVKERRILAPHETCSHMHIEAAKEALARSGIPGEEIELILCCTVSPDRLFPATACFVQEAIGARNAGAMDLSAACAGFIYGLSVAEAMIKAGSVRTALVIGGDALTKLTNYSDRSTCILFGDGAAGAVLCARENTDRGVLRTVLLSDGSGWQHVRIDVGGSLYPSFDEKSKEQNPYIYMNGSEVYRFAVNAMGDACHKVLELAGMTSDQVDLFVPHQANFRIIESAAKRLKIPVEKVFLNVHKYGNIGGGSIPLAMYEAWDEGRLKPGDVVLTVGFGAGLVWGANLIRW